MVFTQGFFRVRDLKIEATPVSGEICVPYWVCFRGSGDRAYLAILDAVRRRPEGAKVRRLVEEWLRSGLCGGRRFLTRFSSTFVTLVSGFTALS